MVRLEPITDLGKVVAQANFKSKGISDKANEENIVEDSGIGMAKDEPSNKTTGHNYISTADAVRGTSGIGIRV